MWLVARVPPLRYLPRSEIMDKPIKIPGPEHPLTIEPTRTRVRVSWRGQVVADTTRALTLKEARYPAVQYVPREDANMDLLTPSAHETYCPYKGDCSYFSLPGGEEQGINAVWSYENPFEAVLVIKDHLAFYADRVDIEI